MNRQEVEKTITGYLKPIFGFALKRCKSVEDAEDLSQEIVLRAFRALLNRDDVADVSKFIWTVAHNTLSNYYRDTAKGGICVPIDSVVEVAADSAADPFAGLDLDDDEDAIRRLRSEIAYLSALQRRIVIAYYFENRRQAEIARELGIPLGTVKWHLFEAKKELKRGMDKLRKSSDLKFNPIRLGYFGINGSAGEKNPWDLLRGALAQNICYCVRGQAKTVNEIADDLGVSPVYVESEALALEEYGLLEGQKGRYLTNFIINEPTAELLILQDQMYKQAAKLFANELYDELIVFGVLDNPGICCWQSDDPVRLTESERADQNFLLWTLIPYIAACSGEALMDEKISFEEVATIRPDGSHNIFHATVMTDEMALPDDYVHMNGWCGPMWNGDGQRILWQIDSQWSGRENARGIQCFEDARRILSLYAREQEERLSRDEYAWLAERGYVKTNGDYDGCFKASWQIVMLEDREIRERLLAIGGRIKAKYRDVFEELKATYVQAVLATVPAHLRKVKAYELQFIFHADGWFLLHCMVELLKSGKLREPTKGQRKALTTLIYRE